MTDPTFLDSLLSTSTTSCNLYDLIRAHQLLKAEVVRLRELTSGLAERVAAQSELLARKAEASEP